MRHPDMRWTWDRMWTRPGPTRDRAGDCPLGGPHDDNAVACFRCHRIRPDHPTKEN